MKGKRGFQKGEKKPATSGMKKGFKAPETREREAEEAAFKQLIYQHVEAMTTNQIEHAKGIGYMMLRHTDGTFTRATDEKQLDAAVAAGATAFQLFTQAPHTPAYMELMNRAFGKPKESVDLTIKDDPATMDDASLMERLSALGVKVKN